jgi:hypothetical protein
VGHARPVTGLLYLYLYLLTGKFYFVWLVNVAHNRVPGISRTMPLSHVQVCLFSAQKPPVGQDLLIAEISR